MGALAQCRSKVESDLLSSGRHGRHRFTCLESGTIRDGQRVRSDRCRHHGLDVNWHRDMDAITLIENSQAANVPTEFTSVNAHLNAHLIAIAIASGPLDAENRNIDGLIVQGIKVMHLSSRPALFFSKG